jgi:hypothetical protein
VLRGVEREVAIRFGWAHVGPIVGTGTGLTWPAMPAGAGVYRFTLRLGERARVYVGETDNFRRRFSHYANPGPTQSTNLKMKARLLELLNEKGGQAYIEVTTDVSLLVDGLALNGADLPDVFVRRLLENAALLGVAASDGEIINGKGFPSGEL